MKRFVLYGWLLAVVMVVGCGTGSTTPAGDSPSGDVNPQADNAAADDSAAALSPQELDDQVTEAPNVATPVTDPSDPGADELTSTDQAEDGPPTQQDFEQQLMAAVQEQDLTKALEVADAAIAAFPEDLGMHANRLLLRLNMDHLMEEQDPAMAAERFVETGALAEVLKQHGDEVPAEAQRAIHMAYYRQARGYAHQGKVTESLEALRAAIDGDVIPLSQLNFEDDPFLATVSDTAEFQAGLAALRRAEAHRAIAETESFAFDFELPDLDNSSVKLADFQGKLLIVDVWGTWCPPCREEIPHLIKLKDTYANDLEIVGINYEHGEGENVIENVRKFAADQGMNYRLVIGDQATQEKIPDLRGFPTTLFLDRSGNVRLMIVGYHSYGMLDAYVTALLEESPSADSAG
jgi:thiol-disulfide isomerase/thioredoxin